MAPPTVSLWIPPPLPESDGNATASGLVLLDRWCYIANLVNDTTAEGTTSTGVRIQVTFRAARPPLVSHFCVHCPGLDFLNAVPKVITTDADLILLCVPVYPTIGHGRDWDYFVYSLRARRLDLIPNPNPTCLCDPATVLLSREDEDGASWYAVAALDATFPVYHGRSALVRRDFYLYLYKSNSSEGWISKVMSLSDLVRDRLVPLPDTVEDRLYHETDKSIAIGGEGGTVAWVDLWRGILFCDVLSDCPVLHDVPLPVPARGNWNRLLVELDPFIFRDVTISRNRDSIKYIETESWSPRDEQPNTAPASYTEWVRNKSRKLRVFRDGWKATTWTMTIPVDFDDSHPLENCWHRHHSGIDVKDVTLQLDASNACPSNLLDMLCCSNTTEMLKGLQMACPIISMDDDIVYLISTIEPRHMDKFEVVLAIDVSKGVLRGLAELDAQKDFIFKDDIVSSDICWYLSKVTGTVEPSKRTAKQHNMGHGIKPTKQELGEPSAVHVKN